MTSIPVPRTPPSMLSSLLGTWTLQTRASSDLGLYKGRSWFVMHVMRDPLQALSCQLDECDERQNHLCQHTSGCIDTSTSISQWSDVSIFFQFGFEIESGTYPWRTHVVQNTSDWLGPYNLVLPQHSYKIESRYVATVATDYLQVPTNFTLNDKTLFDQTVGATAVHHSIASQTLLKPSQDPYQAQADSCANGDLHPILPRLQLREYNHWQLDFILLNMDTELTKVWPTIDKHLPEFPVVGPYCFQGDPNRAYGLNISFDSDAGANNTWDFTQGCQGNLPCWPTDPKPPKPPQPNDDGGDSDSSMVWRLLQSYGVYFLVLALVISWTWNCQLSYQLQREREEHGVSEQQRRRRRTTTTRQPQTENEQLQEPLLPLASQEQEPRSDESASMVATATDKNSAADNAASSEGAAVAATNAV